MDDSQLMRKRVTDFVQLVTKFLIRAKQSLSNIQAVSDEQVRIELVKDFYQMKIDTTELFQIIYTDLINSKEFAYIKDEVTPTLNQLHAAMEETITNARADLADLIIHKI
ncbi:MAG: hypothetical protein QM737_22740 [Ferruginibacter sp.]